MRRAQPILLSPIQKTFLESRARARTAPARTVRRARIILLASAGSQNKEIAARLGVMPETVARWRRRFLDQGLPGLEKDAPRPGRTPVITGEKIWEVVSKTIHELPENRARWSARTMARAAGLSERSVRRIWNQFGLKPHDPHWSATTKPSPQHVNH